MTSAYKVQATLTNGSAIVDAPTGAFTVNVYGGAMLSRGGVAIAVKSVDSASQLTLEENWPGSTATGDVWITRIDPQQYSFAEINRKYSEGMEALSRGFALTSSSPVAIGTGSKTFTVQAGLPILPGASMTVSSRANLSNKMAGVVTVYSGGSITIDVQSSSGSGSFADWNMNISGQVGSAGPVGATGARGGLPYSFATPTAMADPGSGNIRFNNSTFASVTDIAISDLNSAGVDISGHVLTWDDSTSPQKGVLTIQSSAASDPTIAVFDVTGLVDNSGWSQISVTPRSGSIPSDGEALSVLFAATGNKGQDGAGAGDVTGPAGATDQRVAVFSGATGKLIADGGKSIATIIQDAVAGSGNVTGAASSTNLNVAVFSGTTGKVLADGGSTISQIVQSAVDTIRAGVAAAFDTLSEVATELATKVASTRLISTGTGLTGGGDLTADRTIGLDFATQAEAQSGTDTTKPMNPLRTAQAIAALGGGGWTYVAAQATTSGSSVDFTGIPSTATEIVVYFEGMSSAGPDWPYVQLGTSGGVETTGYNSSTMFQGGTGATTTGFYLYSGAATNAFYGSMVLRRHDTGGTKWTAQGLVTTNNAVISTSGSKTLSAQLDRVRIGASPTTFDAGSVAIKYR